MKRSFSLSVMLFSFFTFYFNPMALLAHRAVYHRVSIPTQNNSESQTEPSNVPEKSNNASLQKTNKYRPKMYRKVAGGLLFGICVVSILGLIYTFCGVLFSAPIILELGPVIFSLTGLSVVLVIPLIACVVGYTECAS